MPSHRIGRLDLERLVAQAQRLEEFEEALAEQVRSLPADAGSIIDFLEIPTGNAFDVAPDEAIRYFSAKGLKPTFSYADMMGAEHDKAFTVAKMMNVDMLGQVRASLDAALASGQTFREWSDGIIPMLQSGGWWGRKQVLDPLTGQTIVAQLGSPWRLETIFRTNMQAAYAAGAWQEIEAQKEIAPFLMYDAVDDFRTRPMHAAWDRRVLPVEHPWWSTHYPPNGYNCRCGVIQLSQDELDALGIKPSIDAPKDGSYEWQNPRTGEKFAIPKGLDPGFVNNSGESHAWALKKLLAEKEAALQADMKLAAMQVQKQAEESAAAALEAQKAVAAATAKAALERAKLAVEKRAKEWEAQAQLDAIAAGKEAAGAGAAFKVKALAALKKTSEWPELKPSEQLEKVLALSSDLKAKQQQTHHLYHWKKSILAGKTPTPPQVKAFDSLSPEDKTAVLKQIEDETKAAEAKKAAAAAAEAKKAAKADPSPAAAAPEPTPPDPATMVVVGRKGKGGTPGAIYQDTSTGQKWMVKFNGSEDAVLNEVLAGRLYSLAGIEAPELHLVTIEGKPALASRMVDGIREVGAKELAASQAVREGFAVDAWLANWDVAGLNYDNLVLLGNRAMRIDVGGALRYRAVGGLKGSAFGREVGEIESLRDGTNAQARAVFGKITKEELEASVEKVLAIPDADIRALVDRHGPRDAAERTLLADTLIARKRDLERRFPTAAERVRARKAGAEDAPPPPPSRVTAAEQQAVEASRVNGYGFATDTDSIEDNMVIVHAYQKAGGDYGTRGWLKLTKSAAAKLAADAQGAAAEPNIVSLHEAREAILAAVKSINFRAAKGDFLDATVVKKIEAALPQIDATVQQLAKAFAVDPQKEIAQHTALLLEWKTHLSNVLPAAKAQKVATKLPAEFPNKSIPDRLNWKAPQPEKAAGAVKWVKVQSGLEYHKAEFDRSFAKETTSTVEVPGTRVRFEAELPDGTKIVFVPERAGASSASNAFAMQGVVRIDVPGKGADASGRVFSALEEVGVPAQRADEIARKHLYLNAFARLKIIRDADMRKGYEAITTPGEAGVKEKLAYLKAKTGVDIEKSEGWRNVDGVRQAFGHGRAYQLRPDYELDDFEALEKTHVVYHNNAGLGHNAGSGVFERLQPIIEGGGVMASLTDRVRRGVPISDFSGTSVSSDLASGGGDYLFTRVLRRSTQKGTGLYWKARVLRRMDAITYDSDQFGRTTPEHMQGSRRGQTIADLKSAATGSSNETIFKAGLSIFDDLDRIVLSSQAEVNAAVKWMRSKGYSSWPDGRPLDEVIVTKDKHAANP